MRSLYYDRDGSPITLTQWSKLRTRANTRLLEDTVGKHWVSTVWLGLDHGYGKGPPLIFETMVFPSGEWVEVYCDRYSTIGEARAGHERVVEQLRTGDLDLGEESA